ncbi:N-acetyltransferase [Paenibacillus popilliae]|uniref:N-acetyltransferase n=1 Tax=Paenibacillus popilliae TaxID=78057 RepID=A0ABY3AVE0_PAEPP|nr:N-acetyltransferase [Paenibacillus sp. SDF0028]
MIGGGYDLTLEYLMRSKNIQFRRAKIEDLDFIISLEKHPDSKKYIIFWTRDKHQDALESDDFIYMIVENSNSQKIGYFILSGLSNQNGCIELVRINIDDKGKGYGKETMKLVQEYVFKHLKAHRLWLDVKEHNNRARHVYAWAGFKVEGLLRECIKSEENYESLVIMGMLRNEYRGRLSASILS